MHGSYGLFQGCEVKYDQDRSVIGHISLAPVSGGRLAPYAPTGNQTAKGDRTRKGRDKVFL